MSTGTHRPRIDPRISRRRKAIELARRRRAWVRGGIVMGLAAVLWAALWSPMLRVRDVRLVGGRHTTPAEVAAALRLGDGDSLLLLRPPELARRAEALPWVKRAEVDRLLPGTVRVRIVERRPAAVLIGRAGPRRRPEYWMVGDDGVVLEPGRPRGLPVVAGAQRVRLEPGVRLASPEARAVLHALGSMPGSLRRRVVAVFAPTVERITLSLADKTLVRYGAAEHLEAKNAVLKAVLRRLELERRRAAYVDVRVPASPAVSARPGRPSPQP